MRLEFPPFLYFTPECMYHHPSECHSTHFEVRAISSYANRVIVCIIKYSSEFNWHGNYGGIKVIPANSKLTTLCWVHTGPCTVLLPTNRKICLCTVRTAHTVRLFVEKNAIKFRPIYDSGSCMISQGSCLTVMFEQCVKRLHKRKDNATVNRAWIIACKVWSTALLEYDKYEFSDC